MCFCLLHLTTTELSNQNSAYLFLCAFIKGLQDCCNFDGPSQVSKSYVCISHFQGHNCSQDSLLALCWQTSLITLDELT